MLVSDFHYDLPPELVATHPATRRDQSRLMVIQRQTKSISDHVFSDLPKLLRPGDCLVLNNSRVIPARLHGTRPSGGSCEILLLHSAGTDTWEAMVRPARKIRPGMILKLAGADATAEVLAGGGERTRRLRLSLSMPVMEYLNQYGEMPLPPYILHAREHRGEPEHATTEDRERYQTVYARPPGSVAAPTAGLHFTPELMNELKAGGMEMRQVTLHVGAGTFEPITTPDVESHAMHEEWFRIEAEDAEAIEAARLDPARRVVAVGTTAVRTLETCMQRHGRIQATEESTNIFIYPGYRFAAVDVMITNFHLPESTLLLLVSAFAGRDLIFEAYREAVRKKYRFYSYGDAMLIL